MRLIPLVNLPTTPFFGGLGRFLPGANLSAENFAVQNQPKKCRLSIFWGKKLSNLQKLSKLQNLTPFTPKEKFDLFGDQGSQMPPQSEDFLGHPLSND